MNTPKTEKVISFTLNWLKNNPSQKLPKLSALAEMSGVSKATAQHALKKMVLERKLQCVWGLGYFPIGYSFPNKEKKTAGSTKFKQEELVVSIKKSLESGEFPPNTLLPPQKTLQIKYAVSFPTLSLVLSQLVKERLLEKLGSRYKVKPKENGKNWRLKLLIITGLDRENKINIQSENEMNFIQMVFSEATRRNLDCVLMGYFDWDSPARFINPITRENFEIKNPKEYAGVIILARQMFNYKNCLNKILTKKIPISIWHESGDFENQYANIEYLGFFKLGISEEDGSRMARHFKKLGHYNIAYISPFHQSQWSKLRLRGILKEYADLGPKGQVEIFTLDNYENDWSFRDQIEKEKKWETYIDVTEFKKNIRREVFPKVSGINTEIRNSLRDSFILKESLSILSLALKRKDITAWICANDLCALLYAEYLRRKKIKIPNQISLAGFDNTFGSLNFGLTSYDFNIAGLAGTMIEFILNYKGLGKSKGSLHPQGRVISRYTTASIPC